MRKIANPFSIGAIAVGVVLHAGAAEADLISRTWVSGKGDDANACTRALPCATFTGAFAKTIAGGEIDVLDGGDFGGLFIQHAITIANDGAGTAGITTASNAIAFFVGAGAADAIVLRGLNFNAVSGQGFGIDFATGGSLVVDHCTFQGYQTHPAIVFEPANSAQLWVKDTALSSAGVLIAPQSGGSATARLESVEIRHATGSGFRADTTVAGSGAVDVELQDVTIDATIGASGIVAVSPTSGGPTVKIVADNVTSSHSAFFGFRAVGGTASILLRHSTIEGNATGTGASNGGQMFSYGDNVFVGNTSDGAAPKPVALK